MDVEALTTSLAAALVTLPIVALAIRRRPRRAQVGAWVAWGAVSASVTWASVTYPPAGRQPLTDQPVELVRDGYVSSRACKICHPGPYASWHRSYHRTMTQFASTETVAGPVDGTVVEARDQVFRLSSRGDEVWVDMEDPEWTGAADAVPRVQKKIVQTTGSHSEQFYWVASGKSRKLSILPIMYRLLDEQRWAPLDTCCIGSPVGQQESGTGRWNRVCNKCHSTHGVPRIEGADEMDTYVAELGIACEACHGPAENHVALNGDPRRRYSFHTGDTVDDTMTNPERLDHVRASEVCAQCHCVTKLKSNEAHEQWKREGFLFRPGDDLTETRIIHQHGDDKFWSDGMIRVSGREFNGLMRSPCFTDGEMSCLSCHQLHKTADDPRTLDEWADDQLKVGMRGNVACTQCHDEYEDEAVLADHTNHLASSSGSLCYNCHQPYTTYGLMKAIRSHEVSNPSVTESLATGRPNACNACHLDKTLAWAADALGEWYGQPAPALSRDEESVAAGVLWTLKGDSGVRALMAWMMGWDAARRASKTDWMTPYLIALLRDPIHAVRHIADRSFQKQPEAGTIDYDYVAPIEEWIELTMPAYTAWTRAARQRGRKGTPRLLIDAEGGLDLERFNRLFDQRDNRPIVLNE